MTTSDQELYFLCERIRIFCFLQQDVPAEKNSKITKSASALAVEKTKELSLISLLIKEFRWEDLFKNQAWIQLLKDAQDFNSTHEQPAITVALKVISEIFPRKDSGI